MIIEALIVSGIFLYIVGLIVTFMLKYIPIIVENNNQKIKRKDIIISIIWPLIVLYILCLFIIFILYCIIQAVIILIYDESTFSNKFIKKIDIFHIFHTKES